MRQVCKLCAEIARKLTKHFCQNQNFRKKRALKIMQKWLQCFDRRVMQPFSRAYKQLIASSRSVGSPAYDDSNNGLAT